jgi:glycosyltransferase involved in cell wall biosynthesis
MLAAFERIAESLPDVVLVIAGGGPQADEVRSRVHASRYRARFKLLGPVERQNMPRVVADATVVCVPSFCEPFGMIVLEAMACAKPVAATNTGGIPYLIGPESEMLFPAGDDQSLARILERLLMDHELRKSIGERNRLLVAAHFSWESVAKRLESTYASLAPTRR